MNTTLTGTVNVYGDTSADILVLSGVISGAGTIVKVAGTSGESVLRLTGPTNTYTGNTTVLGGTLSVSGDGKLGSTNGEHVLNDGALSATASFTLNANRTIWLGPSSGSGGGAHWTCQAAD